MAMDEARGMTLEPDRSSRHSVGILASPAEVYQALTDPGVLSRWLVSEAGIDLRPGGPYRWLFGEATGITTRDPLIASGEFVEIVPHESVRMRSVVEGTDTELEFRLDAWRDGTVLTVTHAGFPGEEDWDDTFRLIDQGWASEIQVLKLYLERARGMVFRSRYHEAQLAAPAEDLFERFITNSGLEGWLAERAAADPTPGGGLRLAWSGREPVEGHFVVCDPDRFLVMTWEGTQPSVVRLWLDEAEEGGDREIVPFAWDEALARLAAVIAAVPRA